MRKKFYYSAYLTIMILLAFSCNRTIETQLGHNKEIKVIGHCFIADFGDAKYELFFKSQEILIWKDLNNGSNVSNEEEIKMVKIRPNLYLVSWKEKDGTSVSHLEDFENNIVYSNITLPDNTFLNLKGTLKKK